MHATRPAAPVFAPSPRREAWRAELSAAIRDPETLLRRLDLPVEWLPGARAAAEAFPLLVTESFLGRMRPGDPSDPLLRQILPLDAETHSVPGYTADPLEEEDSQQGRGLLQKYAGRALVVSTGACAVNCRYCFRRHYAYAEDAGWRAALHALRDAEAAAAQGESSTSPIRELILSGGDPLTLDDDAIDALLTRAEQSPALERLRIHSRLPVVLPRRITDRLVARLGASRLDVVVVVHANHAQEIDNDVAEAFRRLSGGTEALLNQSVLLRGVNDSTDALVALSEALFRAGCLPYYLHLLDPVAGAAHFHVPDDEARRLMRGVAHRLPGYLVPRLAREEPGAGAKTVLSG